MPSVVLIIVLIPTVSVAFGFIWSQLPKNTRTLVPEGAEFWALIPVMGLVTWIGWELGPALEQALFVVTDEASGKQVADFRLWWPEATGTPFAATFELRSQQAPSPRNCAPTPSRPAPP